MEDNPRARLLKYIAEHQPVSVKQIKTDLGMSIGSIYHHLSGLGKLVAQDQHKHYMISAEGNAFLEKGAIESSYERMIAKVFCGDKVLNAELLNAGLATIDTRFCNESEFASEVWAQSYGC